MAPPHMHPRSRMTSSLFATTVFASFFVVVLPHILPCPAPRVTLSDGSMATVVAEDGTLIQPPPQRRRRRRCRADANESESGPAPATAAPPPAEVQRGEDGMARFAMVSADAKRTSAASPGGVSDAYTEPRHTTRACPVPKPGGVVGELLGFTRSDDREQKQPPSPPPTRSEKQSPLAK